ncbi:hypothetical protein RSOLAG1IB_11047 [Rhizoctonia solani AG-1 IB]|uniref:VWFA domain-containing protein n=1 Tax=Thanatephorus cucumeris (strain AG1-IB / isolate 7/3/14) TaxID=1108050 RepID=A0A0B7G6G2_THACB|nr:hypothetical protein RSOLAG1IB_11047 [Rhizoctonia solani AG-1 IB]
MSKFDSGPSRPPNIFKNGQPRDTYTTSEPGLDQLKCSLPIYEATRVPLPDSPIEENRHSFAPTALETNETKGGSTESFSPNFKDGCNDGYARDNGPANDNVSNLPNIFRLLDLYRDHGSGGLVEKVLIDQSCLRRLLNTFVPGSYESVSKIDFKALDKCTIKPLGMYGSKHEILRFLSEMNCLTDNSEKLLLSSIETSSDLRSGLYLALPFGRGAEGTDTERAYIFYWPEDSTWDDKAISSVRRNRITFIRYLSKLTDQMIALISPDQARAMVWTASRRSANGHSNQPELFEESRMFSFEVERSTEQEEDAIALAGFTVKLDTYNAPNFKGTVQTYLVPGEEKPGIITALLQPATALYKAQSETMYPMQLRSMIESKTQPIMLGNLPAEQLKILAEHGLREMYPKPFAQYEKRMELEEGNRNSEYNQSVQAMKDTIQQDMKDLNRFMVLSVRDCYSELHPSLGISGFTPENESPHWGRLREKYLGLADVPQSLKKSLQSGDIEDPDFIDLKLAWHTIRDYLLQDPPPLPTRQVAFIAEIVGDNSDGGWSVVTRGKGTKHTSKRIWQGVKKLVFDFFGYKAKPPTSLLSDLDFIRALRPLADMFPSISPFTEGITSYLHTYLHNLGKRLARNLLDKIVKEEERRLEDLISLQRATRSQEESQATKQSLLNELRTLMPSKSSSHGLRINSITNENLHGLTKLRVVIERTIEQGPQMLYTIYPLELTEYDVQKCQSNAQHIPNPTFNSMLVFKFALDEERKIKFVQLVKDKCLVVISGSKQFHLYIDNNVRLPNVIKHGPPKLSLNYDRLGDPNQCIFALDESTRSLALLHNPNSKGPVLSLFGFDEAFAVVRARGSPFLLKDWYDTEAKIDKMCFVSGAEEVCLIETSGRARILSLVTLSFRPASIQISGQIVDAFSAPDGSCLLLLVVQADEAPIQHKLLVFHWASFGATETGINPTVLPASSVGRIVTSFEGRNHIHLVSLSREDAVATSVSLQIKQKATEFSFRSNQTESTTSNIDSETVNNCLIDCHMDVWTRFPVAPAIVRSTLSCLGREPRKLVFASPYNMESVGTYFSRMIVKFERTTCKPINTELESTSVISYSESFSALVQGTQCSRYLLGSFVVELICLIPLHLAITRDNRFIPLKDGVLNPEHERSLLGADVPAIIDSLSIGWYESLFQSYMATKANDWGSLDQNLATHRAQQIERELYRALNRGSVDGIDTQAPLKNLDTDEDIPMHGPNVIFFIPDISSASVPGDEAEIENILVTLNSFCLSNATIGQRHVIGDQPYVEFLQQQLFGLLDRRLEYVRSWVQVNVQRFPANIQDIRNIYNKIDTMALGMRTAVRLCMETCSSCHYLCTRPFRHSNEHQCGTTHICPFSCEVSDDHPEPVGCGLPAGHSAQHMCNVKAHSCGHNCHLIDKNGCARSCVKPMYHESEHLCSARLHSCGEPCSLQDVNVGYRCPGLCHIPWDEPHTRHRCGNSSSCPLECQLCRRLCRERDHFHGLDASAIHLCGQSHDCTSPCAARGICRIETQPSAVEEQFSGRHETFQYTRYSQVEQRLTCVIPIPPGELQHIGEHSHTTDKKAFHYCNVRCPSCQYLCTLPLEHSQQLHETSHGSMMTTQWAIQGADQDARYELNGRNFGVGDEGAPMLCHLVCSAQGRHVHIDFCREAGNCREVAELKHIDECMHPDPTRPKDWISHRLKWARSGFQDPYSREQQAEFAKCDVLCAGPEHNATVTTAANPSYCNLPIFHQPHERHPAPVNGYVSGDGHRFDCPDPARLQQSYHVIFVIDSSGSMGLKDRTPLSNTPVTALLRSHCNNRYGAVLSALHGFWSSREIGNPNTEARQDAYSVVTFDTSPTTRVTNDFTSTTNQLLSQLLQTSARGGTDFNLALSHAQALIQTHWNSSRTPVLVFLSDGQCTLDRNIVYDLCRACVQLGKPLAFYSVSFGPEHSSTPLRDMVQIAQEIYASAPQDTTSNIQRDSCAYYNAMDEIQLAGTFLGIANSLHKPRASLISQSGRRAL